MVGSRGNAINERGFMVRPALADPRDVCFTSNSDIARSRCNVRFVPIADIAPLFDHLVGAAKHCRGHRKAERLGSFEIDDQFVLSRRLHRQICWLLALENTVDVAGRAPELVDVIGTVGDEATGCDVETAGVDRG